MLPLVLLVLGCFVGRGLSTTKTEEVTPFAWKYDVTFAQLVAGASLPDGDIIRLIDEVDSCIPWDQVEVRIELVSPITWWKALRLHTASSTDYYKVVVEVQDNQPPVWAKFRLVELFSNYVVLWKAKSFGTETAIYRISDASDNFKGGHRYTLYWLDD